ncbi:MAG TPA: xanthine dehydrogenase small subunit [Xanthobacteraceae bacterium]|jgi:xanthine dehydrogenase small subunit
MADTPRIVFNGTPTTIDGVPATTTLLDWLRDHACMRGTKEGCAEGDCGACTVVLERLTGDGCLNRSAVNACLTMVGQIDGAGVRTVEGLARPDGMLHPVQKAFAEGAGTQCGFCTPGFVMAAYAFAVSAPSNEISLIHDAIAGNLCRCTGYRPIIEAISRVAPLKNDPLEQSESELRDALAALSREGTACFDFPGCRFFVPQSLPDALFLRSRMPDARLLTGGTDLALMVSQKRERIPSVIYLGKVRELLAIEDIDNHLVLGSAVTYTQAFEPLIGHYPHLQAYFTRIGSPQIRNLGTIGGNIGTASPIGDMLPILLALGARLRLASHARGEREIAAEEFFVDYRRTALAGDELIVAIAIPKPSPGSLSFFDKISKRRDQDIASVCAAYNLVMEGGIVRQMRIAFGGLAATAKRAYDVESALIDRPLSDEAVSDAARKLRQEFQPISDLRAGAQYRLTVAVNLLRRLALRVLDPSVGWDLDAYD